MRLLKNAAFSAGAPYNTPLPSAPNHRKRIRMFPHSPLKPACGLCLGLLLAGCGGGQDHDGRTHGADTLTTQESTDGQQVLNVGGRVFNVPSPVQTALAIRKAGLSYQKGSTMELGMGSAATGRSQQSLLLGAYGADLAYVTVHNDGQRALATMQAIEELASKLEMSNAFDRSTVERFKGNLGNEDSLLVLSGAAFRAADTYLKNNDRHDVSALVLTGGWIESLHLTLTDPAALKDQGLVDRIGEQRRTLDNLVGLLAATDADGSAAALIAELKKLQGHFAGVTSTYTYEAPVTDRAAKTTYINSKSSVNIPPATLEAIAASVAALRSLITA